MKYKIGDALVCTLPDKNVPELSAGTYYIWGYLISKTVNLYMIAKEGKTIEKFFGVAQHLVDNKNFLTSKGK